MAGTEGFRESVIWLAGLYEGEGCTSIAHDGADSRPILRLCIQMTDVDVLERAQAIFGVGRVYGPYARPEPQKPIYNWTVGSSVEAHAVAVALFPFLLSRRQQQILTAVQEWLTYHRKRPGVVERFWAKVDVVGDCLVWRGAVSRPNKGNNTYGVFGVRADTKAEKRSAHRMSYERLAGNRMAHRMAYELLLHVEPPKRMIKRCPDLNPLCIAPLHWGGE